MTCTLCTNAVVPIGGCQNWHYKFLVSMGGPNWCLPTNFGCPCGSNAVVAPISPSGGCHNCLDDWIIEFLHQCHPGHEKKCWSMWRWIWNFVFDLGTAPDFIAAPQSTRVKLYMLIAVNAWFFKCSSEIENPELMQERQGMCMPISRCPNLPVPKMC